MSGEANKEFINRLAQALLASAGLTNVAHDTSLLRNGKELFSYDINKHFKKSTLKNTDRQNRP